MPMGIGWGTRMIPVNAAAALPAAAFDFETVFDATYPAPNHTGFEGGNDAES